MSCYWITPDGVKDQKNCYFRARKVFELDDVPTSFDLNIAAESYYMLWINGRWVGRGPARGSRRCNFYDRYDVADYLCRGINSVAVLVQCMNIPNFTTFPCQPALLVDLGGILGTDQTWDVQVGDEWEQDVDLFCVQVGFMEHRDLRKTPVGWQTFDDDGQWSKARILSDGEWMGGKQFMPRPIPLLQETVHRPVGIVSAAYVDTDVPLEDSHVAVAFESHRYVPDTQLQENFRHLLIDEKQSVTIPVPCVGRDFAIVFDFGQELVGHFALELSTQAGVVVDLAYDESLVDGWVIPARHHYRMADRYITRNGRQSIGNTIHSHGFVYVMAVFRNVVKPVVLHAVTATDCRYPYEHKGQFDCSDKRLVAIWDACRRTISACTTDTFLDCPWRERAFWVNDLVVENLVSLQLFGDNRINAHALRLALSNAREDGWIPGVCPDSGEDGLVLVPTNLMLLLMLRDYHQYSGDHELVRELLPRMLDILKLFDACFNDDGLLVAPSKFWNFFDWSYDLNEVRLTGRCTSLLNWLYCGALHAAAALLAMDEQSDTGSVYLQQAAALGDRIDRYFWDEKNQRYADWLEPDGTPSQDSSQLTHALALLSGALPVCRMAESMLALDREDLRVPELYLHHFVFLAMQQCGMTDQALVRIRRYWGTMIDAGAQTLWEAAIHQQGKTAFWNAGSLCHGFGATPVNYLQTTVLGVTPSEAGFASFTVQPVAHDLDWATGDVPTPHGPIHVRWERQSDQSLFLQLTVPNGTRGLCMGQWYGPGAHQIRLAEYQHVTEAKG
jgi:hypothetical protein